MAPRSEFSANLISQKFSALGQTRETPTRRFSASVESQISSAYNSLDTNSGGLSGSPHWRTMLKTQPLTCSLDLFTGKPLYE